MILQGENLSKSFGGLMAVNKANFQINEGEIVGLIGPNGAGKTTLFNLISGATSADSGKITFHDKNITRWKPHRICKKGIARTFQSTQLFEGMTVFDNIRMALVFGTPHFFSPKEIEKEVAELLELVDFRETPDTLVKDLSVGSQRRIEIARALATKPSLLMLDEVMAGLNPTELTQSIELVASLRDRGITIFMIEHIMKVIMNLCDRIIVFHYGSNIAEGTPDEVANNQTVVDIYLGS